MSVKDWSSDDWIMPLIFGGIILCIIVGIVTSGWVDFEQNKIITECIRAGKIWKDGNCV